MCIVCDCACMIMDFICARITKYRYRSRFCSLSSEYILKCKTAYVLFHAVYYYVLNSTIIKYIVAFVQAVKYIADKIIWKLNDDVACKQ